uniref:WGS project CBMI000000000 data, contig CS3069_c002994 n=1 Tax=Fusarium clavum TaxID=2594811 RepID=A0A090N5U3_9HYPO|nr:unnamed protein product [Fusarium clavum]
MSNKSTEIKLVGWVPEDTNRGTWSLITSCLFTIAICTWTAIHPRVHVSRRLRHRHKFYQLVKAILAPEMVCLESLQEFLQARKAVRRCVGTTNKEFKTIHGFYLCMMGVRYNSGNCVGYRTLWPGQYAWLLNNSLVSWQTHKEWGLAKEDISDKNKADGLVKLAALLQVIWFTLQCITRVAHQLPLATLETMTLAYVFNALVTYALWWEKPKDIVTASFVDLPQMTAGQWEKFENLAMENTYDVSDPNQEQSDAIAWYVVPRDCRDEEVGMMENQEQQDSEKSLSLPGSNPQKVEPTISVAEEDNNVITEWDANLYMTRYWPLLCLLGASFGAIHLVSWASSFPSETERWLWRVSALISVITSVLCMQFRKMSLRWEGILTIVKVGSPLLYLASRVVMAVEAFVGLRAMEPATYDTYTLMNYWFHFI